MGSKVTIAAMSPYGCGCRPLCDECLAQHMSWYKGIARVRGERWARAISSVVPVDRLWPAPPSEKMLAGAARKVDDISKNDPGLVPLLVAEVLFGASDWWNAEIERRSRTSG